MQNIETNLKHLEFIQGVIERMGRNSFIIKIQAIVLISAPSILLLLSYDEIDLSFAWIIWLWLVISTLLFAFLDAYYLWQEQMFRELYEKVRKTSSDKTDFSMKVRNKSPFKNTIYAAKSYSIWPFYLYLWLSILALAIFYSLDSFN